MTEVSIIMPTLNEENSVEEALISIREQCVIKNNSSFAEVILVDSESTDNTVELARPYVDRVISVPKGKLTARNIATEYASGDIIVSVDADCYFPEHWLYHLLKPFNDPNVVATKGKTLNGTDNKFSSIFTWIDDVDSLLIHKNRMVGRNSAYYKEAFYDVGRFDENINQQDAVTIFSEEEIGFGNRLANLGKVIYAKDAVCYHMHLGNDKTFCRFSLFKPFFKECKGVGIERF